MAKQEKSTKVSNELLEGENPNELIAKRFRVQFDYSWKIPKEKIDGKSLTVPDLSLTVRQLLEHHSRNSDGDVSVSQPFYMDFPIPNIQDITDVVAYKEKLQDLVAKTDEYLNTQHEEWKRQEEERKKKEAVKKQEELDFAEFKANKKSKNAE